MEAVPISADVASFVNMLRSLFQTSQVHLRELIQNGLEATFQAVRAGAVAQPIHIETRSGGAFEKAVLTVTDHGVGMTGDELRRNLGSVFVSGWPTDPGATLGIGQFGFGFYTVFLVAERVEVVSRSMSEPARAHRWSMVRGAREATIEEVPAPLPEIGTTVEAHIEDASGEGADPDLIIAGIHQQYLYVPYPIFVNGVPVRLPRVEGWRQSLAGRDASINDDLRRRWRWDSTPLLVAPVHVDNGGLLAVTPDGVTAPGLEVYRRGVRVTEQEIIPPPLNMFICGLVDMVDVALKPDRESLRQDENFVRLRTGIGDAASAMLTDLAGRSPDRLRVVFEAHRQYLVAAMRRDPRLRRELGPYTPLPLYFPGGRDGSSETTLCALGLVPGRPAGAEGPAANVLQWASDRGSDQLFADRARYLGATPVFLGDRQLLQLVRQICADHRITMRHVALNYLRDVERNMRSHERLRALFRGVVEDGWDVMCVEDVDSRVPVRIVLSPLPDEPAMPDLDDLSSPEAAMAALLRMFGPQTADRESVRLVVVNIRNTMIHDLQSALGSTPEPVLSRFAQIMVALAKFTAQTSIDAREFNKLNRDVLSALHEQLIDKPKSKSRRGILSALFGRS